MYRLHKWLGIAPGGFHPALVVGEDAKWMVGWENWLEKPARPDQMLMRRSGTIEGWLRSQRGLAGQIGEWVFYVAVGC